MNFCWNLYDFQAVQNFLSYVWTFLYMGFLFLYIFLVSNGRYVLIPNHRANMRGRTESMLKGKLQRRKKKKSQYTKINYYSPTQKFLSIIYQLPGKLHSCYRTRYIRKKLLRPSETCWVLNKVPQGSVLRSSLSTHSCYFNGFTDPQHREEIPWEIQTYITRNTFPLNTPNCAKLFWCASSLA